jgi:hypothetical protein
MIRFWLPLNWRGKSNLPKITENQEWVTGCVFGEYNKIEVELLLGMTIHNTYMLKDSSEKTQDLPPLRNAQVQLKLLTT